MRPTRLPVQSDLAPLAPTHECAPQHLKSYWNEVCDETQLSVHHPSHRSAASLPLSTVRFREKIVLARTLQRTMPTLTRPYHSMSQEGNYERTICKGRTHAKTPLALVPAHYTKNIEIAWRINNMKVGRTDHLRHHVRRPNSFPRQHTKSACPADFVRYVPKSGVSTRPPGPRISQ